MKAVRRITETELKPVVACKPMRLNATQSARSPTARTGTQFGPAPMITWKYDPPMSKSAGNPTTMQESKIRLAAFRPALPKANSAYESSPGEEGKWAPSDEKTMMNGTMDAAVATQASAA